MPSVTQLENWFWFWHPKFFLYMSAFDRKADTKEPQRMGTFKEVHKPYMAHIIAIQAELYIPCVVFSLQNWSREVGQI